MPIRRPSRTDSSLHFETYAATVEAAEAFLRNRLNTTTGAIYDEQTWGTIKIKNTSGTDRDRFDVLGIAAAQIFPTPTDNLNAFKNGDVAFQGVKPTAEHIGRFAILLQPLPVGKIGLAIVAGIAVVRLDVTTATDLRADVAPNVAGSLKTGPSGAARILYKESGTGLKWAVVLLGDQPIRIKVKLTANLDAWGSATGQPQKRDLAQKKWVDDTSQAEITVYDMDGSHFGLKGERIDAELAGIDGQGNPIYEAVTGGEPIHDVALSGTLSPGGTANATWGSATIVVTAKWISTGKTLSGSIRVFYDKSAKQWKPMVGSC